MKTTCRGLAALLALLMLLAGCGKQKKFDAALVAERYTGATIQAGLLVTAHSGIYAQYRLDFSEMGGKSVVAILEPKSVAGITATLTQDSAVIGYAGMTLDSLLPEADGFTPMDAMTRALEDLRGRVPDSVCSETIKDRACVTLCYQGTLADGTKTEKQVSLDAATLDFCCAELYLQDDLTLTVEAESFTLTAG